MNKFGVRQREVLRSYADSNVRTFGEIKRKCSKWAEVEFFLYRTLGDLIRKGAIKYVSGYYRLKIRRNSSLWRKVL